MNDHDAMQEYISRGGTITKCPPRVCAHGYSPHTPDHALGDTSKGDAPSDNFGGIYHKILRRHTLKGLENSRRAPRVNPKYAAIYAELRQLWMDTPNDPVEQWKLICTEASKAKISTSASRDRFIKSGVDVGSFKNIAAMTRGGDLPKETVDKIVKLRESGMSCDNIGPIVKVGKGVVYRTLKELGLYKPLKEKTDEEKLNLKMAADEIINSGKNTWSITSRKYGVAATSLRSAVERIRGIR